MSSENDPILDYQKKYPDARVGANRRREPIAPKKTTLEVMLAQWPVVVALICVVFGFCMMAISFRFAAFCIGVGLCFFGYWALANKSEGYNF